MISTILFSLSALCFAAMLAPGKPTRRAGATLPVYTYSVRDEQPLPTWHRKVARPARVAERVGRAD